MEGSFVEEDVLYRRTFCKGGRLVEGRLVEGRFEGRRFCSEGRFMEGRSVLAPVRLVCGYLPKPSFPWLDVLLLAPLEKLSTGGWKGVPISC